MPLPKPYPPTEIDYEDWNDLADNYAGKAVTLIVDKNGKGDYSTIQEAVDALPSSNAGEILVKGGEYMLTQAVYVKDRTDLVIRGVGKATRLKVADKVQSNLVSDAASGQKDVVVTNGSLFQVGQHVSIKDSSNEEIGRIASISGNTLTMEENLTNSYTVAAGGKVFTCHDAIYITGTSKRIKVLNLAIDGSRANQEFDRYGWYPKEHHGDGVRLSATTEECVVENCWLTSCIGHNVCVGGSRHRIAFNHSTDCYHDGVNVEPGVDQILVLGNHCWSQAAWNGIQVGYLTNDIGTVLVVGNICHDNKYGISICGPNGNVQVVGNTFKENSDGGVHVYNCSLFLVSGNTISGAADLSDMTEAGIIVKQASSVGVITGNLIEQGAGIGIHIEQGSYLTITGNTIRKVKKHGVKAGEEGSDQGRDCTITGNVIVGADQEDTATYSGIAVIGDRNIIQGNRLDDCDKYCIHITSSAEKTLVLGNQCTQFVGTCVDYIKDEGTGTKVSRARSFFAVLTWGTVAADSTIYLSTAGSNAVEADIEFPIPFDCTLRNLRAHATGAPGAGESYAYTLRKNGADTALTCTISDSATDGADTANAVAASAGDRICNKLVTSAGAAVVKHTVSFEAMLEETNVIG